ncbi:porphyromonas-type peptidyl-arginine deiminase [Streptomyces virginiae]|uniref:Porphyromonas-type peptidyl-arginine deiminase n=2 Tax=Streptomyces virginiae TaxID=1961 RepID=A0ABQ3NL01_STRVG|nr:MULTISPECIES: agmatine deiminase family protein [Streptomyces]KOV05322.1 peptidyl-arginine deiminase [Streptomyces sp. XY533]MBP2342661.1 agmatine deiminase [Streptomyces virginiae]MCI4080102.1 agmatine deiminase family protein [Streptomyces sp. MMS21 TC-5]GGQ31480.1 porphyromonas-type peptidyl-arginine deiminase [Streptomyces virginiae]GHI13452.1 porphyromonas-type peptidyl-arginine deiminase [Streptomyces virginiae]
MDTSRTTRRRLLQWGAAALPLATLGPALPATAYAAPAPGAATLRMPEESERHLRTYMAWPALTAVWEDRLDAVRGDIADVAYEISRFEPVVMLARPGQAADARYRCGRGARHAIDVIEIANDDLWIRDFGPTFVVGPGAIAGVDTNFNGWGKTGTTYAQPFANDAAAAGILLDEYGVGRIRAGFVGEGGSLETDGEGTLLATVSSLVNPNRNPGMSREQVEQVVKSALGIDKVIWVPGLAGQDITDCHIDCLARFTSPGRVILDRPGAGADRKWVAVYEETKRVLESATDARGRRLAVTELPGPDRERIRGRGAEFLSSYTNYYTVNGAVIVPQFGDGRADGLAYTILQAAYPDRQVVQVAIDNIAAGGGGIHCATQSHPAVPPAA